MLSVLILSLKRLRHIRRVQGKKRCLIERQVKDGAKPVLVLPSY